MKSTDLQSTSLRVPPEPDSGKNPQNEAARETRWWVRVAVTAAFAGGLVFAFTHWSWTEIREGLLHLNPVVAIVLMAVLPIFGFSVAATYVLAGARFGLLGGGLVIAGATAVHLLGSHFVARTFVRDRLQRLLARHRHRIPSIPPGENATLAAMVALVPGLPYFVRNYALALSDVPLRVYFWVCLPIYVLRSYVTLALGDLGAELTLRKAATLGAVLAVKLAICTCLLFRLRARIKAFNR